MSGVMKWVYGGVLLFVVCLVAFPFYMDYLAEDEDDTYSNKVVEIEDSFIVGYEDGRRSWSVNAEYVWAGRSKYLFRAEGIQGGQLFSSTGELVVDGIRSDRIQMNSRSKTFTAMGDVSATFLRTILDDDRDVVATRTVSIVADQMKFFSRSHRTYLSGNVVLSQEGYSVYPKGDVILDTDKGVVFLENGFQVISEEFVASGDRMVMYLDEDYSEIIGNVVLERKALVASRDLDDREQDLRGKPSRLESDFLKYSSKGDVYEVDARGSVLIRQEDKVIEADRAIYSQEDSSLHAEGNVKVTTDSLVWLMTPENRATIANAEIKEGASKSTVIKSDELVFDSVSRELFLDGGVILLQEGLSVKSGSISYADSSGVLHLKGDVLVIQDGEKRFSGDSIRFNIREEGFDAQGDVETYLIVD